MARMFISYSRTNKPFVKELVTLLGRVYSDHEVWFDEDIGGGEDWWECILGEIARCDLFIFLISNKSLESEYCQAEFREALRLQKMCLPVLVVPKSNTSLLPPNLEQEMRRREWVNMSGGFQDYLSNAKLYAAINQILHRLPQESLPPLSHDPVSKPDISLVRMGVNRKANRLSKIRTNVVIGLISLLLAVIVILIVDPIDSPRNRSPISEPLTASSSTDLSSALATNESQSITSTLDIVLIVRTMDADATKSWEAGEANSAAAERATSYAAGTQDTLNQTVTARLLTTTSNPNTNATVEPFRSQQGETAIAEAISDKPTQMNRLVTTATDPSTLSPEMLALTPVPSNNAWSVVERNFNDVEMVMVPAGCFNIGDDPQAYYWDGTQWKVGVAQGGPQCFSKPFWIDRYEVTNQQFRELNGIATHTGDWLSPQQPRTNVTWFEARDFCENNRAARLPTEVEWEYAARGPDHLIYPWGNEFVAENVVYSHNSGGMTADVGSKPGGMSWVGAYDLGGNVWEWVRSLYKEYPYNTRDGRESESDQSNRRVLRGGSWFNDSAAMRAATRLSSDPSFQDPHGGFRCARS